MNQGLLGWPKGTLGQARFASYFQEAAQSYQQALNGPVGANTKGSWTEIVSRAPFDVDGVYTMFGNFTGASEFLVDFGVGNAGAERVIVPNISFSGLTTTSGFNVAHSRAYVPCRVPAGSRFAMRLQSSAGSAGVRPGCTLAGGGFYRALSRYLSDGMAESIGVDLADSGGTAVDTGASANTKGSWVDLGRTSRRMRAFMLCFGHRSNANTSTLHGRLDVGLGPSRTLLLEDYPYFTTGVSGSTTAPCMPGGSFSPLFFSDVPAGTLLGVRGQSSVTDATDRVIDVAILAFA